jgi:hypothetical protein
MPSRRAVLLQLLAVGLSGCAQAHKQTTAWFDRFRYLGPKGPDVIQMDVALVERPLGDGYLNRSLWTVADEQVIALDSKAILEDNGFRIGQIGGITPVELQSLLTSERSCANPRRIQLRAGKSTVLELGPEMGECRFQLAKDGEPSPVTMPHAQPTLEIHPSLTEDGRTRLRFVPIVQHGDANLIPKPAPDRSGWLLVQERPSQRYSELAWEVTLAPNEYLVVGGRFDRPETLGHQCFLRRDEATPVQRLLVIRTGRSLQEVQPPIASGQPKAPPLACQATWTKARGNGER